MSAARALMGFSIGGFPAVSARRSAFAAIWWDIGLVATPARSILAAASVAHDAVDEWRAEFPFLLHDVPCCFRITRWTHRRLAFKSQGRQARSANYAREAIRAGLAHIERAEWPSLPGRNDYRGNVRDTAWLDEAQSDVPQRDFDLIRQASEYQVAAGGDLVDAFRIGSWRDMQPNTLPPPGHAPNCRCTPIHYSVAAHQRLGAELARAPVSKTPRQRIDRAGRRRRKRGRR